LLMSMQWAAYFLLAICSHKALLEIKHAKIMCFWGGEVFQ
jgi:hypothetical protein